MLGSEIDSAASPADEMTLAVVPAVYVLPTPGVKKPNVAGAPSVSESVAGTAPPTGCTPVLAAPAAGVVEAAAGQARARDLRACCPPPASRSSSCPTTA